jgi:hypothetical protein
MVQTVRELLDRERQAEEARSPEEKAAMMIDQVGDRNMLTIGEDVECYILATDEHTVWPRPGPDKTPVAKVSFVTKVGDLGCGVGYYK